MTETLLSWLVYKASVYSYLLVFTQCLLFGCLHFLLASIFLGFPSSPCKYKEDRDNLWSMVSIRFPEMKPSGRDFGEDINGETSK